MCYGAVALFLGKLAALLSEWPTAARHFEDALVLNNQMKAWPWLTHTQYELALMRQVQGKQMTVNLSETLAAAQAMGMDHLAEKVMALQQAQ